MKILKLLENDRCHFCQKQKTEVCEIELDNGRTTRLCWRDLQKLVRMNMQSPAPASVKVPAG